ncbi:MAG: hypothetical protein V3573_13420 [Desulfovibrionaceae bacterium]
MKNMKAIVVLLLVFASGAAVGSYATMRVMPYRMPEGPPPARHMVRDLSRYIGLTDAQKAEAERIFESHREEVEAALGELKPRLDAILDKAAAELKPSLDDAQRIKLDELVVNIKEHKGRFHGPPPE